MKNNNHQDEMVDILTTLHQYVLLHEVQVTTSKSDAQVDGTATTELLHKVLFGGDLLTAIRAKRAQHIRQNSEHPVGRLEGFIPVAEDWHAKVVLMEVYHQSLIVISLISMPLLLY